MDKRARYKSAFETIRDKAIDALKKIETPPEQRSMRWRCKSQNKSASESLNARACVREVARLSGSEGHNT